MMRGHIASAAFALLLLACARSNPPGTGNDSADAVPTPPTFRLTSSAFGNGGAIPAQFTCDGANQSPPLSWSGAPVSTKTYTLIVDDPDAPGGKFVHWVIYNLPASVRALPVGVAVGASVRWAGNARQGENGFNKIGYGGPCPPKGQSHAYHFRLFALDGTLAVKASSQSRDDVVTAMRGHEVGHTQLVARYSRR